jgi:glycosyltransferase involved in cell wall biosynthesis
LLGWVSDKTLLSLYQHCEALVFPITAVPDDIEGFGMVAIEAAAAGRPTIAFDEGGVGNAVIEGVLCDHLAFRAPHVDLQVWVERGAQPLPRKLVITTRDLPNAPQFAVTVTKWNLKPAFTAQTFSFKPPAGATKLDFLAR